MKVASTSSTSQPLPRIYAWFSAMMLDDFSLMEDLLTHGLNVDTPHPLRHTTALMEATRLGRANMVEWLLRQGASPALLSGTPQGTPLHCALRCKQWHIASLLLNSGSADYGVDSYGRTPLHMACLDSVEDTDMLAVMEIIYLLVGQGCPVDTLDVEGVTALHYTVINDNYQLTEQLLVHGANPNIPSPQSLSTPLMIAALEKNMPIIGMLLQYGANPHQKNTEGVTPLDILPTMQRLLPAQMLPGMAIDLLPQDIASNNRLN